MTSLVSRLLVPSASVQASGGVSNEEYDLQLRSLLSDLKHLLAKKDFSVLSDPDLHLLDPSSHSLSYLFILHLQLLAAQTKTKKRLPDDVLPGGQLWNRLVIFLRKFDPIQVRYAGQEWRRLLELVEDAAEARSKTILAVKPIKEAILRLDPSSSVLTSCHVRFVKLCLRCNTLIHAIPILEKPICYVPKGAARDLEEPLCAGDMPSGAFLTERAGFSETISPRDFLEYFLHGAMVYMLSKRWRDALHFLNIVISTPTVNCVSLVMVEAYKKWVLASLLAHGKLIPLPKLVTGHVSKLLRSLARAYLALAEAFEARDLERLKAEMGLGQTIWHEDNNTGLVCQLTDALRRFTILDLGGTFAALPVTDIVGGEVSWAKDPAETESFIASAILSQSLNAKLVQKTGGAGTTILRFSDSPPPSRLWQESSVQAQMVTEKQMLSELMSHIERSDHNLELSKEYVDHLHRARKRAEQGDGRGFSHGSRSEVDHFDFDEDIMDAMD